MSIDKKGLTIVELLIALTITTMVLGGLLSFNIQLVKGGMFSEQKNQINRDIRKITTELSDVSKESNYFVIYESFDKSDRDEPEDRLYSNQSGDFVIFVYTSETAVGFGIFPVERIVGYYRESNDVGELVDVGPVRKFDVSFNTPVDITSSITLEELIPSTTSSTEFNQVVELSKGTIRGNMFYNFANKSVMVNGQLYHGQKGNRSSDTYNFTVSPRG